MHILEINDNTQQTHEEKGPKVFWKHYKRRQKFLRKIKTYTTTCNNYANALTRQKKHLR